MPGKRKARNSGTPSAAKRAKSKWSASKFGSVVEEAGLLLGLGDQENLLKVDPAVFQRDISRAFKRTTTGAVIDGFMDSFREYLDNPARLRSTLMPTGIAPGADVRSRFGGLDSLMRMLLGVDELQTHVMDALLEWLPDYMSDGDSGGVNIQEYLLMPKLMLSQLRMLHHLVDGKDLCDKLLEIVEIAPHEMKREIITALPEILDDPQHNDVAQKLKTVLSTNSDLTAAIVDALSNLNISDDITAEALDVAINSLPSANIHDLPTVIKFINENLTQRNAEDVILEVREKLNLDFSPTPIISSTPLFPVKQNSKSSDYFMVLDTIRSSICFQKVVTDGWIKAVKSVSSAEEHRVIDVFVLFVLHSITAHKKAVEKIFCEKIKDGCFSNDLMNSVFDSHPGALREFFSSILRLCESLLCFPSPAVSSFAASLYQHLFTAFDDIHCRRDVVDALVIHISNGMKSEVDRALDVLLVLLKHHCKAMLSFISLIKTMLDHLGHFNMQQIRKLYQVYSGLAFADLDRTSAMQSELHTIIRKQLTHFEARYRHIGVIGSVMIIHQIAKKSDMCEITDGNSQDSTKSRRQKMAVTMLDEAMNTCSRSQQCSILFSDEMCSVVSDLDSSIVSHLCEAITSSFQDDFLVEVTDGVPKDVGVPVDFRYALDSTDEGSIGLNLLPLIAASKTNPDGGVASGRGVVDMAAKFHLLRTCEEQLNGNMEAIDALLGCPVLMCPDKVFDSTTFEDLPESQRNDICLSIFYCINWFRELVCAFAKDEDLEMKGKVLARLENITDLQNRLETCMTATPGFWPPSVTMAEGVSVAPGKPARSSKSDVTLASMTAATINIDKDGGTTPATPSIATPTIPIHRLRPYFRELSLSVFQAFHFGCLSRTTVDSDTNTREHDELCLRPAQLIFLLDDLCTKLTSSFQPFGLKSAKAEAAVGYRTADLVKTMADLMTSLCGNLDKTRDYFLNQLAENDGVMDAGGSGILYPQRCLCFHLLLKSLYTFFSWSTLHEDPTYLGYLRSSLLVAVASSGVTVKRWDETQEYLEELAHGACKYFEGFSDFLPTLTCGHALGRVLVAICKTCKAKASKPAISIACGSLLQRPWKAVENTQHKNNALSFLLKYHVEWAADPLEVVETLAGDATVELIGEDAVEVSSKYPTLTSATFPRYYSCMLSCLVSQLKAIPVASKKKVLDIDTQTENFCILQVSVRVFGILVNLVQSFNSKHRVLYSLLRFGRAYIEAFIKSGMPLLNSVFRTKKDEIVVLLKTFQSSTRFLQHCCGHSKLGKYSTLINQVPHLKKTLETFLFRVKELMANNHCPEAFWMGVLKNRDLKGEEILSQQPEEEEEMELDSGDDHASGTTSSNSIDLDLDSDSDLDMTSAERPEP